MKQATEPTQANSLSLTIKLTLVLLVALSTMAKAEKPYPISWCNQIGTNSFDIVFDVTVNGFGNVFVVGSTGGQLNGGRDSRGIDAFVAKYDSLGKKMWIKQLHTKKGRTVATGIAIDILANTYITGYTEGNLVSTNAGDRDIFLVKFDTLGKKLWSRQFGTIAEDSAKSIAIDSKLNILITGITKGDLGAKNSGSTDIFISKYSPSGKQLWLSQLGSSAYDDASDIAIDKTDNVYVTGTTSGVIGRSSRGHDDAYLVKLNSAGKQLQALQFGTAKKDTSNALVIDNSGIVYFVGTSHGDVARKNAGSGDIYIIKHDMTGKEKGWLQQLGTENFEEATGVSLDSDGNLFVVGTTAGSLGNYNAGKYDFLIAKYTAKGVRKWIRQIGTPERDRAAAIAIDLKGNILVSGTTQGSVCAQNHGLAKKSAAVKMGYSPILDDGFLIRLKNEQ